MITVKQIKKIISKPLIKPKNQFYGMTLLCATLLITPILGENAMADATNDQWQLTQKIWSELRANNLYILDEYYDDNIHFEDAFGEIDGLKAMKNYYGHLYENVESIEFIFTDALYQKDKQFFSWVMKLKAPALNSGEEISLKGASHIKFSPSSGKVIYHRDYFDTGEFIYENVIFLKWIHKMVKNKMHP